MNRTKSRTTELELSRLPTFDRNAVIAAYQPYKTAPVDWQIVQPLAIEIGHLLPDLSERTLRNRMWHISQLLLWAHLKRGVPLNVERMLDPNLVDEWIHKCGWSDGTTRSSRWIFSQLGLAAKAGWSPKAETARSRLAAPYSTRELKGVWETVACQHTSRLRYVAAVIVTLGLATGADGRNLPHLTRGDISSDEHGTWVHLQAPERRVPVHPRWEVFMSELRIGNPEDRLVGGRYTVNGELGAINQRRSYACPPIQLARLRSTYVVELIERRLPLQTLVAVTGLTTAGRLADFLPCCTKPTDDEIARDVRGER